MIIAHVVMIVVHMFMIMVHMMIVVAHVLMTMVREVMVMTFMFVGMMHHTSVCGTHTPHIMRMMMVIVMGEHEESTKRQQDEGNTKNESLMSSDACKVECLRACITDSNQGHHDTCGSKQHSAAGGEDGSDADWRGEHSNKHGHGTDAWGESGKQEKRAGGCAVNGGRIGWRYGCGDSRRRLARGIGAGLATCAATA